jgi:Protein of unknown function (DUF3179)
MLRLLLFLIGLAVLIGAEIMKVYYIMPFPGSQVEETINLAYFIHTKIWLFRIVGVAIIAWPAFKFATSKNMWIAWPAIVGIGVWFFVMYSVNFAMLADKMFVQPKVRMMASVEDNKVPLKNLVVAVSIDGESRAYPIQMIGYHHQVRDSIAGRPIMVTYCTVCRTGRVFSPIVDGQPEQFRLVGMDHFNAMFEDSRTQSWWRQANGEAITGELKGKFLEEIPSEQMRLSSWIEAHPETKIFQGDPDFKAQYDSSYRYDEGKEKGRLERTDSISWMDKSWVIGVQSGNSSKAYDWIETLPSHVVNDTVGPTSVLVAIEPDSASFHVWKRPDTLVFEFDPSSKLMMDSNTGSKWNWNGTSVDGPLKGAQLQKQQAYQEYWHSWRSFHPKTTQFK